MPILAGLLVSLFSQLTTFLGLFFAARLAIRLAAIAAFTSATLVFLVATEAVLNQLVASFPSGGILDTVYWLVFPPEVITAIGLVLAFDLSVTLYRMTTHNISVLTSGA